MKKKIVHGVELLIYAVIVGGLLWVAFFVTPTARVSTVEPSLFGGRNDYYGVTTAGGGVVWMVGSGGHIVRSDDGGKIWRLQPTGVNMNLQDIAAWDARTAVVVGDEATVLRTTDGGQHWQKVPVASRNLGRQLLRVYARPGSSDAWITGAYGTLFKSVDRGTSWKMSYPPVDHAWNDVTVAPDGSIWLVGEFGSMAHSTDGGENWQSVNSQSHTSLMSIVFANATDAVAVGLSGTITHTTDGGRTWSLVLTTVKSHLFDVTWSGTHYVTAGDDGVVGQAGAAGADWSFSSLSGNDFSWYTKVAAGDADTLYLAGALPGVLRDGKWQRFEGQTGVQQ